MKVLIIEDEERGFSRLKRLLLNMDHTLEILGPLTSIKTTIEYLQMKHDEDVIFADIRLGDGDMHRLKRRRWQEVKNGEIIF